MARTLREIEVDILAVRDMQRDARSGLADPLITTRVIWRHIFCTLQKSLQELKCEYQKGVHHE